MKIIFIANNFPPQICGVGDYTFNLAQGLIKSGYEIKIFRLNIAAYMNIRRIKPDLVSIQYTPSLYRAFSMGLGIVLLAFWVRILGIRCITTFHERYRAFSLNPKLALLSLIERINFIGMVIASESIIFCAQHWLKDYQKNFSWLSRKAYYLPVCSSIPYLALSKEERDRRRYELKAKDETIILGSFCKVKNYINYFYFDALFTSFEALKEKGYNVLLLLIGWPSKQAHLYDKFKERLKGDEIITTGQLPPEGVSRYLSMVDIYFAPFNEGVSTRKSTIMAAMSHGLPIVSTRGVKMDNIFDACDAIKLVQPKKELFIDALINLAANKKYSLDMGKSAKVFYDNNFSWDIINSQFIKIIGN